MKPLNGLVAIEVTHIRPHPDNVRDHVTDVQPLAASIKRDGLLNPLIVERLDIGGFRILAGHRRFAAVKTLGWREVPCLVRSESLPDETLALMLAENTQRRDLDPIEQARALKRLKAMTGATQPEVAQRVGRSDFWVSQRLQLLTLPQAEQDAIQRGDISSSAAYEHLRDARRASKGTPKASRGWEPDHLNFRHPLATAAREACTHTRRRKIGATACGQCWEAVIRDDATGTARAKASPSPLPTVADAIDATRRQIGAAS